MSQTLKNFFSFISKDIGIDLGTRNTVVYSPGVGIVLSEPSMVAMNKTTGDVMATGYEAYNMVGRTPGNIIAVRPMKDGVVADFSVTEKMVSEFVKKTELIRRFHKPRILIGIPWGITSVEKRAVCDAAFNAGAGESLLIEEPMAAAVGADLDVTEPRGKLIVDIGGGTTEVAVISLSGIVVCKSLRLAGDEFDEAIIQHCRQNYNLLIGDQMAERVKIEIGSAIPFETEKNLEVKGRDLVTGLPKTFTLSSYEIRDALSETLSAIVTTIRATLEDTPPELSGDILKDGIIMTGGGALLYGICEKIEEETQLKVRRAKDPLTCVADGTGKILENQELMQKISSTIISRDSI
ncbi:rod shape-determining protein [Candidatus Marinamargulisbacteria bacterium SCGC AG-414-C22]|nr:rod shape-determining protein [Candidatus Marinamargulisbacteria bacterium SCGC AG-414-C22]